MRSRIAVLVFIGVLVTGASAAVAASGVSGLVTSGNDQARSSQTPVGDNSPGFVPPSILPDQEQGTAGEQVTAPTSVNLPNTGPSGSQPGAQVSAGGGGKGASSLPFTGFLAMAVLAAGFVLLASGLLLRRRQVLA